MESKFKNKIQIAVSGTRHTVTTDKNKVIHRKLISNPLPFQQTTTTPAKKINTRQNTADQPTCSKTLDKAATSGAPCIYSGKEAPKNIANYERSEDWSKRNTQKQQGTIHLTKQKHDKPKPEHHIRQRRLRML